MRMLRCSALYAPKAGSPLNDYEDSFFFACSADGSRVAISDGAGAAFESRRWARLLTESFIQSPPRSVSPHEVLDWSARVSERWQASFNWAELKWFEQERIMNEASAATFAGLHLRETAPGKGGEWSCMALGDSCVFQVSRDRLVQTVPVRSSADFGKHPPLFYTDQALTRVALSHLATPRGLWAEGDRFLFLTDAIAAWFLREVEQGGKPWDDLAELDQDSFVRFIDERRLYGMPDDDVTAVILEAPAPGKVHADVPPPLPDPARLPDRSDPPLGSVWTRLLKPAVLVSLAIAVILGILIGKAINGGSASPARNPSATASLVEERTMEASADSFMRALVTSDGSVSDYEQLLDPAATPALAARLPQLLDVTASTWDEMTSSGAITFTVPGTARDTVYVGAAERMSTGRGPWLDRFLLVLLSMTRTAGQWRVGGLAFQPTAGGVLPSSQYAPQATKPAGKA